MDPETRIDVLSILLARRTLFLGCLAGSLAVLIAAYLIRIRSLPAEVKFNMALPVASNEDLGTFSRRCFFDSARLKSGVSGVTGDGNAAPIAVYQETSELFTSPLASIHKTSASLSGTYVDVTLMPSELGPDHEALYRQFVEKSAIPAVICHAWLRALTKVEQSLGEFNRMELINFPDYHFYRKTIKARIASLRDHPQQGSRTAGRNFGGANIAFIHVGRLAVPAGTQLLTPKDQETILGSTIDDIDNLISYGGTFVSANAAVLKQLKSIELAGPIQSSVLSAAFNKAVSKDDWIYELLQKTKGEFEDTVERFAADSAKVPSLTTNVRYHPKLRHLAIVAAVAGLAAIFLTLIIAAYQTRKEPKP